MYAKELVPPCGLYCGVCSIHKATIENDASLKEKLAKVYGVPAGQVNCNGCLSANAFVYCRLCPIKSCTQEKHLDGCHQCADFPCGTINSFPFAEAKENILRSIPRWRELGTEEWIKEEEDRCRCKSCGTLLFRGAKKCRHCQAVLA